MTLWNRIRVLALLGMCAGTAGALDRNAFTFANYDLQVQLDPEQQRLAVRGKITLRNDSDQPQNVAALQISSSLNWRSIRSENKPLQFTAQTYTSDIDHTGALREAIVTLPRAIQPKESVELEIGYEGVIVLDATRLTRIGTPENAAKHSDWDQIGKDFTAVRGVGYVAWYPVAIEAESLSEGNAMFAALGRWKARQADASMSLHIALVSNDPEAMQVLCNGLGVAPGNSSANCAFAPLGLTVPAFAAGPYKNLAAGKASILSIPEHSPQAAAYQTAMTEALPLIEEWFGEPQGGFQVIDLPNAQAAPFESGTFLLTPLEKNDPKLAQILLAHQLTHAAFASPRPWIYEGLAHFAQALQRERQAGREAALDYLGLHRAAMLEVEKPLGGGQAMTDATDDALYHSKAALVWWMLRDMVGDAVLKRALKQYKPEQDTEPAYFEKVLQAESKRDLGWFFHDWIYTDAGLPDFHVEAAIPRATTGTNYLTAVTVENSGVAGAEVLVTVRSARGDSAQKLEVRGKAKAVTRFTTNGAPLEVIVNDGSVPESDGTNNRFSFSLPPGPV